MDWNRIAACCLFALAAGAGSGQAQLCVGRPLLAGAFAGNAGIALTLGNHERAYSGGATVGRALFGSAGFTFHDARGSAGSRKSLTGAAGYAFPSDGSTTHFCARLDASYTFGTKNLAGADLTTSVYAPGLAVGFEAEVTPGVTVVPFARAALVRRRLSVETDALAAITHSSGLVVAGVGIILNDRLGLRPSLSLPFNTEFGAPGSTFTLDLRFAFGPSR